PISGLILQKEWNIPHINILLREAVLQPAVILIYDDDLPKDQIQDMGPLLRIFSKKGMILFFQGNHSISSINLESSIHYNKLEFNTPRASKRVIYWQQAIKKNKLNWSEDVAEQLAMRYPLSEQEVDHTLVRLHHRLNGETPHTSKALNIFKKIINDYTQRPLDELAQRIDPKVDWQDLVVHKSLTDHLKAFRNTIAHQFTVYEKWGMGDKNTRGRGAVALFSGNSGTGKTMSAEVIASDLGINLYRVDLAGIVSKYIGETEKNLKKIFQNAKGNNTLLFFDEADSLFGKRTDIHDSHDRYANLEVNYLLQQLEEHDGPVILASNRRKSIDEAFLRRIHFILEFPSPSEPLRKIIWQKKLADPLPKADDIDFDILAKQFEISGGDIKNGALQAAFLAAENKTPVSMIDVLTALKREYLKLGKHFPISQINHKDNVMPDTPQARRRKKEIRRRGS
ncbi:MAG: ATP-binding protein, partial [Desulfobacteraceae bacterium]|nr:ATP-binding protein [Desulfobacteraceae bacterium]